MKFLVPVAIVFLSTVLLQTRLVFAQSIDNTVEQKKVPENNKVEVGSSDSKPESDSIKEKLYWIFLTTGKSLEGVDTDEVKKLQAAHLANFKRLAEAGSLLSAGPTTDPNKTLRGIVVARAKDEGSLSELFKPDPYIQSGYMNIEAAEMKVEHGAINTGINPKGLEEFRIVVFEQSAENNGAGSNIVVEQDQEFIKSLSTDESVRLAVSLDPASYGRRMIMIMNAPQNDELISEKLKEMPAIKSGALKSQIIPLYLGKGTLKKS